MIALQFLYYIFVCITEMSKKQKAEIQKFICLDKK